MYAGVCESLVSVSFSLFLSYLFVSYFNVKFALIMSAYICLVEKRLNLI